MTASTTPVARPSSTGRSGAGANAAGEVSGPGGLSSLFSVASRLTSPARTDAAGERWLSIPEFNGYEASDLGRIRSWLPCTRHIPTPRILKQRKNSNGYLEVSLQRDGVQVPPRKVHRLVLAAFVGPCPEGMETRHLDGDRSNNALTNLRYGTAAENAADQRRHGTRVGLNKTHCPAGHAYDEANTYRDPAGKRSCRACRHARAVLRAAAAREEREAVA